MASSKTYQAKRQQIHMWQSRMEIDDHFVTHFNHITACVKLQLRVWLIRASFLIRYSCTYKVHMSLTLSGSSVIHCLNSMMYSTICNGIIFCFCLRLPHTLFSCAIHTLIQPVAESTYMYFTESREGHENFNQSTSTCNSI